MVIDSLYSVANQISDIKNDLMTLTMNVHCTHCTYRLYIIQCIRGAVDKIQFIRKR